MQSVLPEKREDRRHSEEEERECRNWVGTMLRWLERHCDKVQPDLNNITIEENYANIS